LSAEVQGILLGLGVPRLQVGVPASTQADCGVKHRPVELYFIGKLRDGVQVACIHMLELNNPES
jgi:hypothetical protein